MIGKQVAAARALVGWTQGDLAKAAGVSDTTVKRAEGTATIPASERALERIRAALEAAGVEFIEPNGGGPGVRLRGRE
ncbi:helix-turn-helix domain-containing protein [Oceanicella actignis]|uniref:helix-turn-helix domain-containing protein n=1 Tax=Oceanicella actignis TaxID=1189325 RepID=UPI0009347F5D|nr:helix-turn-helix domain-containing protein [Oceanicella actignis]